MFEPMLLILAWPVGVFAYVLFDLHRHRSPAPQPVQHESVPAWQSSVSAAA